LWIFKHREANYGVEIHLNASMTKKNSTNGIEPIGALRIWKHVLIVKKNDIWMGLIHVETKLHTSLVK
jgi:hypothetical protein